MMYYCYASSTNILLYTGMYITVEGMALFLSGSSLPMVDIVHCYLFVQYSLSAQSKPDMSVRQMILFPGFKFVLPSHLILYELWYNIYTSARTSGEKYDVGSDGGLQ
jgi:hypothetical protein